MQADFWHQLWERQQTGWHLSETNPFLKDHFNALELQEGNRIFVPLCGKSLDIAWLLDQGLEVVAVELNEGAVCELFNALQVKPEVKNEGAFKRYSYHNITIFVGDFFNLELSMLGKIDAVYDRAALVALPPEMRKQYTKQLCHLAKGASQLLITFEYDQGKQEGPPFSVPMQELHQHYCNDYTIVHLQSLSSGPQSAQSIERVENICLLTKK